MKIVGLMLARAESWVLGASIDAALRWVDELVLMHHGTMDGETCGRYHDCKRLHHSVWTDGEHWLEMDARQKTLEYGRNLGGTHFAIIDADEILTHNNLGAVRDWFEMLQPGQCLDLPMIAPWKSLDVHSTGINSVLTLGFADAPHLAWKPRGEEKYHFHQRSPGGSGEHLFKKCDGGVFHLQWAPWRRFIAKHRHYMASERVRWPMYRPQEISEKYSWWARLRHETEPIPAEWWGDYRKSEIALDAESWHEAALSRLFSSKGEEAFKDIDFSFGGVEPWKK